MLTFRDYVESFVFAVVGTFLCTAASVAICASLALGFYKIFL